MIIGKVQDCFHEQLLCSLKLHRDGLLEVTPGFSTEERDYFDGDSEIFVSPENLDTMHKNDCKITSFSFTTPKGAMYRYTLEWAGQIDKWEDLENLSLRRMDEEYKLVSDRRRIVLSKVKDHCANIDRLTREEHLLQIEIVSASNFYPMFADVNGYRDNSIYVRYQIIAQSRWTANLSSGQGQVDYLNRRSRGEESGGLIQGRTRASKPMQYSNVRPSNGICSLSIGMALLMVS